MEITRQQILYISCLTKPIVQQISNEYLNKTNQTSADGLMTFSLVPSKNGSMAMGGSAMNDTMMMMPPGATIKDKQSI